MTAPIPTDRELEALKVLWARKQATVREICDAINRQGEQLAYTTVLSLMQVMEQKGLVNHVRVGKAYTYHAKVHRDGTFCRLAEDFLDRVFDGAVDEYLVHALRSRKVSEEEIKRLEKMLAEAKERESQRDAKGEAR